MERNGKRITGNEKKKERWEVLLDFWFGSPSATDGGYGSEKPHWWSSNPQLDKRIRDEFEGDHLAAKEGKLEHWKKEAYSTLALILLLDQIPRNIYRGKAEAYASGGESLATAKYAVAHGYDQQLKLRVEKKFMYMPFNHAEDLEAQAQAKLLFKPLGEPSWSWYADHYYEIIERFGRFPHRNQILGRTSTAEERQFLKSNQF